MTFARHDIMRVMRLTCICIVSFSMLVSCRTNNTLTPYDECISNFKEIGNALKKFALDHNGDHPASLQRLVEYGYLEHQYLLCPFNTKTNKTDNKTYTDYVYISGVTEYDWALSLEAFCPPVNHRNVQRIPLLVASGSVYEVDINEYNDILNDKEKLLGPSFCGGFRDHEPQRQRYVVWPAHITQSGGVEALGRKPPVNPVGP